MYYLSGSNLGNYHNIGQLSVVPKFKRKGVVGDYGWPRSAYKRYQGVDYFVVNDNYPYPLDEDVNRGMCLMKSNLPSQYPADQYFPPCNFYY